FGDAEARGRRVGRDHGIAQKRAGRGVHPGETEGGRPVGTEIDRDERPGLRAGAVRQGRRGGGNSDRERGPGLSAAPLQSGQKRETTKRNATHAAPPRLDTGGRRGIHISILHLNAGVTKCVMSSSSAPPEPPSDRFWGSSRQSPHPSSARSPSRPHSNE